MKKEKYFLLKNCQKTSHKDIFKIKNLKILLEIYYDKSGSPSTLNEMGVKYLQ